MWFLYKRLSMCMSSNFLSTFNLFKAPPRAGLVCAQSIPSISSIIRRYSEYHSKYPASARSASISDGWEVSLELSSTPVPTADFWSILQVPNRGRSLLKRSSHHVWK